MGLLADCRQLNVKGAPTCTVAGLFDSMTPEDAAELGAVLADRSIAATTISRVLMARGFDVRAQPLQRHRRGECTCDRYR
jgi:hypothetical protein